MTLSNILQIQIYENDMIRDHFQLPVREVNEACRLYDMIFIGLVAQSRALSIKKDLPVDFVLNQYQSLGTLEWFMQGIPVQRVLAKGVQIHTKYIRNNNNVDGQAKHGTIEEAAAKIDDFLDDKNPFDEVIAESLIEAVEGIENLAEEITHEFNREDDEEELHVLDILDQVATAMEFMSQRMDAISARQDTQSERLNLIDEEAKLDAETKQTG